MRKFFYINSLAILPTVFIGVRSVVPLLSEGNLPSTNCKKIFRWLVVFYGISTLIGYLMPNPVYTHISNISHRWIACRQHYFQMGCLNTVEWFQVLLPNTNHSINHYLFVCTQLNGSKYCHVILIIQFNSHLLVHSLMVSSRVNDQIILFDL